MHTHFKSPLSDKVLGSPILHAHAILLTPVAARQPGFHFSNPGKRRMPVLPVVFVPVVEALVTALTTVAVQKFLRQGTQVPGEHL